MSASLHIIGAGGYAKCIADAALSTTMYDNVIFYDINPVDDSLMGFKVLSEAELFKISEQSLISVGIGDNNLREKIVSKILSIRSDLIFPTIIHKLASISKYSTIGEGSVLLNGSVVGPCAKIGAHVCLYSNAVLEHDTVIEDFVTLAPSASTGGNVKIGKRSFLGLGACINHGIKIGDDTIIGAGACVTKDFQGECVLVGTPAKKIKDRKRGDAYL